MTSFLLLFQFFCVSFLVLLNLALTLNLYCLKITIICGWREEERTSMNVFSCVHICLSLSCNLSFLKFMLLIFFFATMFRRRIFYPSYFIIDNLTRKPYTNNSFLTSVSVVAPKFIPWSGSVEGWGPIRAYSHQWLKLEDIFCKSF